LNNTCKRDLIFDVLKGVAIIAIVMIHSLGSAYSFKETTGMAKLNFWFAMVMRQVIAFAVPVFFFTSGYWVSEKIIKSCDDYLLNIKQRISRIGIPYVFWSIIAMSIAYLTVNQALSLKIIMIKLLTGGASTPYYFIIVLVQCYMITPLLKQKDVSKRNWILILLLNIASILMIYITYFFLHKKIVFPYYALPVVMWIVYFYSGYVFKQKADNIKQYLKNRLLIITVLVCCLALSIFEAVTILNISPKAVSLAGSTVKLSSLIYSLAVIATFICFKDHITFKENSWLVKIGRNSFGIFFIHMFILPRIVKIMSKVTVLSSFQPLYQLLVVSITVLLCYLVISLVRNNSPKTIWKDILGFE
jgi:probable poly-beta-1,6-N-acetyl-D-glucosamine export protein